MHSPSKTFSWNELLTPRSHCTHAVVKLDRLRELGLQHSGFRSRVQVAHFLSEGIFVSVFWLAHHLPHFQVIKFTSVTMVNNL